MRKLFTRISLARIPRPYFFLLSNPLGPTRDRPLPRFKPNAQYPTAFGGVRLWRKMANFKFYLSFIICHLSFFASPAFAQKGPGYIPGARTDVASLIRDGLALILAFVGIASILAIIFGSYRYMSSGGDKYALSDAQKTVTNGVIGLVIALTAYLIVSFVWRFITGKGLPGIPF